MIWPIALLSQLLPLIPNIAGPSVHETSTLCDVPNSFLQRFGVFYFFSFSSDPIFSAKVYFPFIGTKPCALD